MTPKEKAAGLINKMLNRFEDADTIAYSIAKDCALIAVDEIIENTKIEKRKNVISGNTKSGYEDIILIEYNLYWQEVKQEIENL